MRGAAGQGLADRWDLSTRVIEPGDDLLLLHPGRIVELSGPPGMGLTRLGYRLLAEPSQKAMAVLVDVRGWMSPGSAWETGVSKDRLIVVRCPDPGLWLRVTAALCEGIDAMVAEVPVGVHERDLRRLAALVRARQTRMALRPVRGRLPAGVAHTRLNAQRLVWTGVGQGHGRLEGRRLTLEVSGKGAAGMNRMIEVEDMGEDLVRVVSGLAAGATGRAV